MLAYELYAQKRIIIICGYNHKVTYYTSDLQKIFFDNCIKIQRETINNQWHQHAEAVKLNLYISNSHLYHIIFLARPPHMSTSYAYFKVCRKKDDVLFTSLKLLICV